MTSLWLIEAWINPAGPLKTGTNGQNDQIEPFSRFFPHFLSKWTEKSDSKDEFAYLWWCRIMDGLDENWRIYWIQNKKYKSDVPGLYSLLCTCRSFCLRKSKIPLSFLWKDPIFLVFKKKTKSQNWRGWGEENSWMMRSGILSSF